MELCLPPFILFILSSAPHEILSKNDKFLSYAFFFGSSTAVVACIALVLDAKSKSSFLLNVLDVDWVLFDLATFSFLEDDMGDLDAFAVVALVGFDVRAIGTLPIVRGCSFFTSLSTFELVVVVVSLFH